MRGLPEEVIAAEGAELPEDAKPLLDWRIDAVHVEDGGALALARSRRDERARDLARGTARYAPEKAPRRLARGGGENREVVFE